MLHLAVPLDDKCVLVDITPPKGLVLDDNVRVPTTDSCYIHSHVRRQHGDGDGDGDGGVGGRPIIVIVVV